MQRLSIRLAALTLGALCTVWAADPLTAATFTSAPDLAASRLAPWLAQAPADQALGLLRSLPPLPATAAEQVMASVFAVRNGPKLRRALLTSLRTWPVPEAGVIDRVAAALRDDEAGVREAAIAVLRAWRPEHTAPALAACVADPVPRVASEARRLLTEWAGRDLGTAATWVAWATERVERSEAICAGFAKQAADVDAAHAQLLVGEIIHSSALREDREALLLTLARNPDRRVAELAEEGLSRIAPPGAPGSSGGVEATVTGSMATVDAAAAAEAPAMAALAPLPAAAVTTNRPAATASADSALSDWWTPLLAMAVVILLGLAIGRRVLSSLKTQDVAAQGGSFAATIVRKKQRT